MSPEIWAAITAGLALAIAGYALYRARQTPSVGGAVDALQTGAASATEIMEVVRAGVFAAEQLKSKGKLPDNNAAFAYAYRHAQRFLPNLSKAELTTFIEANVLLAKQITGEVLPPVREADDALHFHPTLPAAEK